MRSFLQSVKAISRNFNHSAISLFSVVKNQKVASTKLWMLLFLSGGVSISYSLLAAIMPSSALAGDLEFAVGSYTTPPNGPSTTTQTATLLNNTVDAPVSGGTFVTYTPTISMSAAFSNQQYTGGLTFGATINNSAKTPVAQPVFNKMNSFGSPTSSMFTSTSSSTAGTGISVVDNYAFEMFASVEPLFSGNAPTNGRYYYGDLTLTFNRPVSNPVIQMVGFGGVFSYTLSGVTSTHGHSVEVELSTTGITASKLSGSNTLSVTGNKILNSASTLNSSCVTNATTGAAPGGACGSVLFTGTNITTLTFKVYVRGDNQSGPWSTNGISGTLSPAYSGDAFLFGGVSVAQPVTVSGTVFKDANGLTDSLINGTGANAGGLFANLVDGNSKVVASTNVTANGTYSFLAIGTGTYSVSLSTTAGVQGNTAPAASLPSGWANTAEGTATAGDGTVDGSTSITVGTTDVTGVNFGIEQLPTAVGGTATSQVNPGGTTSVPVLTTLFTGSTDPDGTIASYKVTAFPSNTTTLVINGTSYTSGSFPVAGVTVPVAQLNTIQVDPIDGTLSVGISFKAIDNAGQASSNTATATLPFTAPVYSIQGNVFDDLDGSKIQAASGENYTAANITAVLLDASSKVVSTTAVDATGNYTLTNVPAGTYTVKIIQTPATALTTGAVIPPANDILPTNWVATGENNNGTPDATVDRTQSVTVTSANITNINFGIEQLPTAVGGTATSQVNPGGTTSVSVPTTLFTSSTDPDGTVASYKITAFPTNTTTLIINGTSYTSVSFPAAGVTVPAAQLNTIQVDPIDGTLSVGISFKAIDNAGQASSNTATATLPFTASSPANLLLVKRITAINGVKLNVYKDDTTTTSLYDATNDNNINWPLPLNTNATLGDTNISAFLQGAIDGGKVKPGDTIEYTIYFLNTGGGNANNVRVCDRIIDSQKILSGSPIQLQKNSAIPTALTSVAGDDRATFYASSADPAIVNCNFTGTPTIDNGAIVVDATGATGSPTWTTLPSSTGPGTTDTYGFVRFTTKVNP
jgi:SdrD B-like domain